MTGVGQGTPPTAREHEGGAAHDLCGCLVRVGGAEVSQACLPLLGVPIQPLHSTALNCTPYSWSEEAKSLALISALPGIKDKGRGRPKAGLGRFGWRRLKSVWITLWLWWGTVGMPGMMGCVYTARGYVHGRSEHAVSVCTEMCMVGVCTVRVGWHVGCV